MQITIKKLHDYNYKDIQNDQVKQAQRHTQPSQVQKGAKKHQDMPKAQILQQQRHKKWLEKDINMTLKRQ